MLLADQLPEGFSETLSLEENKRRPRFDVEIQNEGCPVSKPQLPGADVLPIAENKVMMQSMLCIVGVTVVCIK